MKETARLKYCQDMVKASGTVPVTTLNITELRPEDVQPYGVFLSGVPLLLPPGSPGGDPDLWTLMNDVTYVAPDGTVVALKTGDKSDLASTPNWTKMIWGGAGRETVGSLIHDEGCGHPTTARYNIFKKVWWTPPRSWFDNRFWDIMSMFKTPWIRKTCFWVAVRGWSTIRGWWQSLTKRSTSNG